MFGSSGKKRANASSNCAALYRESAIRSVRVVAAQVAVKSGRPLDRARSTLIKRNSLLEYSSRDQVVEMAIRAFQVSSVNGIFLTQGLQLCPEPSFR